MDFIFVIYAYLSEVDSSGVSVYVSDILTGVVLFQDFLFVLRILYCLLDNTCCTFDKGSCLLFLQ